MKRQAKRCPYACPDSPGVRVTQRDTGTSGTPLTPPAYIERRKASPIVSAARRAFAALSWRRAREELLGLVAELENTPRECRGGLAFAPRPPVLPEAPRHGTPGPELCLRPLQGQPEAKADVPAPVVVGFPLLPINHPSVRGLTTLVVLPLTRTVADRDEDLGVTS